MDTIILFGASRGGRNFIDNNIKRYKIAAIVDNDKNKQGKFIYNIPIILPEQIHLFKYDYIVVSSMYVNSITNQLNILGISKDKIRYASKNSMKVIAYPFKDKNIHQCANQMIDALSNILKDIKHFYTFGTLLGIVRDGHLIPWDDDIDIAIYAEDALNVKDILLENISLINRIMNTKMYIRYYSDGTIASISIDCYYSNEFVFNINLDCIFIEGDFAKQELNNTPIMYFEDVEKYNFNNNEINVPKLYESYLEYTYGDWRVIKENTSFMDNTLSFVEPTGSCKSVLFYEFTSEK